MDALRAPGAGRCRRPGRRALTSVADASGVDVAQDAFAPCVCEDCGALAAALEGRRWDELATSTVVAHSGSSEETESPRQWTIHVEAILFRL
jgi:hypothetical protein